MRRPPESPGGKARDHLPGIPRGIIPVGRREKDVAVSPGGPAFIIGPFNLNRLDEHPRNLAVIGGLATDRNFLQAGQIIGVPRLGIRGSKTADRSAERVTLDRRGGNGLGLGEPGKARTHVRPQPHVDAHVRNPLLKGREVPPILAVRGNRCHEGVPEVPAITIPHLHRKGLCGEPGHEQGDDNLPIRPGGERPLQPLPEGAGPDVDGHDIILGRTLQHHVDLVDSRGRNFEGCRFPALYIQLEPDIRLAQVGARLKPVLIPGRLHRHLQHTRSRQFPYWHGERRGGTPLRIGLGCPRSKQKPLRNKVSRSTVVVAPGVFPDQGSKNRVIQTIEFLPFPHGCISPVALNEAEFLSHRQGLEGKGFFGQDFSNLIVCLGKKRRAIQLHRFSYGIPVDSRSKLHPKTLNARPARLVNEAEIERLARNVEVSLHHLGGQQESVPVVLETFPRNAVSRQSVCQVILNT